MYSYYLAYDDGNILIRDSTEKTIQRYDHNQRMWVDDFDMCGIYSGDIPVKTLTLKEVEAILNNDGYSNAS